MFYLTIAMDFSGNTRRVKSGITRKFPKFFARGAETGKSSSRICMLNLSPDMRYDKNSTPSKYVYYLL